jgi:UDP-GlcNAc:undecaprenyl-phosphate GlcNAc-1-phosphate transferase
LALAAWYSDAWPLAACCLAVASASAGFLTVNFPPARVFMGDAGSIPLGFLAGAFGLEGIVSHGWPWWFPVVVFSPFIADASITLLRRLLRGVQVWRAHREHAYQRLVLQGWSKRELAVRSYMAMALTAVAAMAALWQDGWGRYAILSLFASAWVLLFAVIERRCRKAPSPDRETPASGFGP